MQVGEGSRGVLASHGAWLPRASLHAHVGRAAPRALQGDVLGTAAQGWHVLEALWLLWEEGEQRHRGAAGSAAAARGPHVCGGEAAAPCRGSPWAAPRWARFPLLSARPAAGTPAAAASAAIVTRVPFP